MAASDSGSASGEETISRSTIIYIVVSILLCAAGSFCIYRFVIRDQGWLCTARNVSLPIPATARRRVPTRRGLTSPVASVPRTFKPATAKAATSDLKNDYVPPYSCEAVQAPPPPYPVASSGSEGLARCPSYQSELGYTPAHVALPIIPVSPSRVYVARNNRDRVLPVAGLALHGGRSTRPTARL